MTLVAQKLRDDKGYDPAANEILVGESMAWPKGCRLRGEQSPQPCGPVYVRDVMILARSPWLSGISLEGRRLQDHHPAMSHAETESGRYNVGQYLALAECGLLTPDDHVELLDGFIVAMTPSSPYHSATLNIVQNLLQRRLGPEVNLRVQMCFVAGEAYVPEPDIAVVPGTAEDYLQSHPSHAYLIVEVSESSVAYDRLTKSRVYARAGVPCYWIVNVRDGCVEEFREPDPDRGVYGKRRSVTGAAELRIDAFAGVAFVAQELLPPRLTARD